jgi:hypothetical protein
VRFFEALRDEMSRAHERFKHLGYFDTTFGVRVRDQSLPAGHSDFVLSFEVFDCTGARSVDDVTAEPVDFVLDGELSAWVEMLRNIKQNGGADVQHSINTLTHFGEGLRVVYDDPDGHDKLYRFAESIQEFFDLAGKLDLDLRGGGGVRAGAQEAR